MPITKLCHLEQTLANSADVHHCLDHCHLCPNTYRRPYSSSNPWCRTHPDQHLLHAVQPAHKTADDEESAGWRRNIERTDACLMNCLETLYEVHELAPYIISATYYTPDVGGEYSCLVNRLATSTNYAQAVADYCDDVADYWLRCEEAGINPGDYDMSDINAISSEQLRQAAPTLKAFIDQLTQDYSDPQLAQEIDAVTATAVANESQSPLYDLSAYFDDLATYEQLHFDKLTGWSRWLKMNRQKPLSQYP